VLECIAEQIVRELTQQAGVAIPELREFRVNQQNQADPLFHSFRQVARHCLFEHGRAVESGSPGQKFGLWPAGGRFDPFDNLLHLPAAAFDGQKPASLLGTYAGVQQQFGHPEQPIEDVAQLVAQDRRFKIDWKRSFRDTLFSPRHDSPRHTAIHPPYSILLQ
jgi:hypothetical protein